MNLYPLATSKARKAITMTLPPSLSLPVMEVRLSKEGESCMCLELPVKIYISPGEAVVGTPNILSQWIMFQQVE